MAFSTLRKYSTQHSMSPSVAPSKGSGGGAPSGGSAPAGGASGSPASDNAALAGMGAVGAGLLGKFAYDKYNKFQRDNANAGNEMYEGVDMAQNGPNADVLGGLGTNSGGIIYEPGQAGLEGMKEPAQFAPAEDVAKWHLSDSDPFKFALATGDPVAMNGQLAKKIVPGLTEDYSLNIGPTSWNLFGFDGGSF